MARITRHATLPRISQTLNGNVSARESSSLVLSRANELLKRWRMPDCSEKPKVPTGQAGGILFTLTAYGSHYSPRDSPANESIAKRINSARESSKLVLAQAIELLKLFGRVVLHQVLNVMEVLIVA